MITNPVTAITLDGTAIDLATVEWNVYVSHGRQDIASMPQASTAVITLVSDTGSTVVDAVSKTVNIKAYGVNRFTGIVTEVALEHLPGTGGGTSLARTTLTAIGPFAQLAFKTTGESGFLEETVEDRVAAILDTTGLTYTSRPDPDMVLLAAAAKVDTVDQLLANLCVETGATMSDLPDGSIKFESYTRRGYDYNPATWAYMSGDWSSRIGDWTVQRNQATAAPEPFTPPADAVIFEPQWAATVYNVVNDVTVAYGTGDPQDTVNAQDADSITRHGKRSVYLPTTLSNVDDATKRAAAVITAQSASRWKMRQAQVFVDQLDPTSQAAALALVSGDRVLIEDLPQPAPSPTYLGVVEGWTETFTPASHTLTLALSDPRASYAMAQWISVPSTLAWSGVSATVKWYDVVLPTDLAA